MNPEDKKLSIFSKNGAKKIAKPFVFLFLVNFLIINWNSVSWAFNYKLISGTASKFLEILENKQDIVNELSNNVFTNKENSLEIPKIGVTAPVIVAENSDQNYFDKELDRGVVIFPNSVLPGGVGQTIVLGHSAPSNWPKINYDGVFSRITELKDGDEIVLYFNNEKYSYFVNDKIFLEKGEEIPNNETSSDNTLLLISCWPPGKNIQRIIIKSKLIKT